jgi:hypothetical protein
MGYTEIVTTNNPSVFHNRMNSYKLSPENKQKVRNTTLQILTNNKYDPSIIKVSEHKKKNQKQDR